MGECKHEDTEIYNTSNGTDCIVCALCGEDLLHEMLVKKRKAEQERDQLRERVRELEKHNAYLETQRIPQTISFETMHMINEEAENG